MFNVYAREALVELMLNNPRRVTLPTLFANIFGHVFVPNGNFGG